MKRGCHGMRRIGSIAGAALLAVVLGGGAASAAVLQDLGHALEAGKPTLELRLGYEYNNLAGNGRAAANGLNLRTRLGYRTGNFHGASAYIQFHNLSNLVEDFSFTRAGQTHGNQGRDVIADPDGSRIQQAYLDIATIPGTTIRLGRQEIILDDARLIGNVDWRQNGQSFNAAAVSNRSLPDLTLYGAFINQVNTITLDTLPLDSLVLLHGNYTGIPGQKVTAFCYLLDTEVEAPTARDSATYGMRFAGKLSRLKYAFDYARQQDYQEGEGHRGNMFDAFLGSGLGRIEAGAGYSYISGRNGSHRPFDTLFSTAHKFNGWADEFLATNGGTLNDGLQDMYLQVGTKIAGNKVLVVYHYFDTTENNSAADPHFDKPYGDEFDALVSRTFTKHVSALLKYAYYDAWSASAHGIANPTHDRQVFWARVRYAF